MEKMNRITFKDNPYPRGHLIKNINWSGRLDANRGLVFDFHLESEPYVNSAPPDTEEEEEGLRDWYSRGVWENYQGCILSSTAWGSSGITVAQPGQHFSFNKHFPLSLEADTLPLAEEVDWDDLALGLYLLGHDACADHRINITRNADSNSYDIHWTGKIALAYVGEVDFNYDFEINLYALPFEGIHYPQAWSPEEALDALSMVVDDPEAFTFEDLNPNSNKREYKLVQTT